MAIPSLQDFTTKGQWLIRPNVRDSGRSFGANDAKYYQNFVDTAQGFKDAGDTNRYNATLATHGFPQQTAPAPAPAQSGGQQISQAIASRPQTEADIRAGQLADATQAQTDARAFGLNKLNNDFTYNGFDPANYSTQIDRYLNNIGETINPYDANAKQYYTGDLFGQLKSNIETADVSKYQNQLDQFLGSGWENQKVNSSLGESTLNSILSQQYGDATGAIDRAYNRGTLTDTGKQYSLGQLGQQYSAGYSQMDNIRDGIEIGRAHV